VIFEVAIGSIPQIKTENTATDHLSRSYAAIRNGLENQSSVSTCEQIFQVNSFRFIHAFTAKSIKRILCLNAKCQPDLSRLCKP